MKLTTSELKNHLLLDHSSNPSVCAPYLLNEAQKMVNVTPRQCITKYAKATSKQEGHMDHHIRGSYHNVNLNRALMHWLSCANLPYNVLDGGVFMNRCCTNNPWYRVACRPYIQHNFLDTGYAAAKNAFCIFWCTYWVCIQYQHTDVFCCECLHVCRIKPNWSSAYFVQCFGKLYA